MSKYGHRPHNWFEGIVNKMGGEEQAKRFLRGDLVLAPAPLVLISISRQARPPYPHWIKEVLHPEFECSGPTEYNLATVKQWLHQNQKRNASLRAASVYEHLKANSMLGDCLNLQDALAIQAMGVETFRQFFEGKMLYFWKSAAQIPDGDLCVPYLFDCGSAVLLEWCWAGHELGSTCPALRFASPQV